MVYISACPSIRHTIPVWIIDWGREVIPVILTSDEKFAEANAALLVELESTEIAMYARRDMVSRGSFKGFRVHLADDHDGAGVVRPSFIK